MTEAVPESSPEIPEMTQQATYRYDRWGGLEHYTCLHCGHETWGEETLRLHMQQLHDGLMVAEVAPRMEEEPMGEPHDKPEDTPDKPDHPEHPHGGPPGQTGEHPEHPHGGPPGQEPHPEHPIVVPDEEDEEEEDEEEAPA